MSSGNAARPIEVSAGLVFHQGRLLITQRRAGDHLGGLWEFPGGKRQPDESFQQCLVRELVEELGITVDVGSLLESLTHDYPEKSVHLNFYRCRLIKGVPEAIGCADFRWVQASELMNYSFPAADGHLLEMLVSQPELWA